MPDYGCFALYCTLVNNWNIVVLLAMGVIILPSVVYLTGKAGLIRCQGEQAYKILSSMES